MSPDRRITVRAVRSVAPALLALLAAALVGCGYHVVGRTSALPAGIHTIAVPAFTNRTSEYRVEQRFTEAVVRELLERTRYRVVATPEAGDAVLRGEIISMESSAMVFDSATGRATTILVTLHMRVRLEDRATGNVLFRNDNFLFREPYEVSTDVPVFFQQEGPAFDRMARDFAMRLVADMLENF